MNLKLFPYRLQRHMRKGRYGFSHSLLGH